MTRQRRIALVGGAARLHAILRRVVVGALLSMTACTAPGFTLLSADVGTDDETCAPYGGALCKLDAEDRVRDDVAKLAPDVVSLQRVVAGDFCDDASIPAGDDGELVCARDRTDGTAQVRRILGDDYNINCRGQLVNTQSTTPHNCIAVRSAVDAADGREDHLHAWEILFADENDDPACSASSLVIDASLAVRTDHKSTFRLVNARLTPGDAAAAQACRASELTNVFADVSVLRDDRLGPLALPVVITGDFNIDPYVRAHRGAPGNFELTHNVDVDGEQPRDQTPTPLRPIVTDAGGGGAASDVPPTLGARVFDHVFTDDGVGTCQTLGETAGTDALGDGAVDHRALFCNIALPEDSWFDPPQR